MFRNLGIICVLVILLLAGCSPERNLARQYVKTHTGSGIMIIPSFELYKDNNTIGYDTAAKFSPDQLDSIAWAQSVFIKNVSDSVYLTLFTNSLISELTKEGFDVYVDASSDVFLSMPDPKWVVQIAQLELNEDHFYNYYEMYSVETGEPYYDSVRVNEVSLSSWTGVNLANSGTKQVLYLEGYIKDKIKFGVDFSLMDGSLGTYQHIDSIQMDDVYKMAEESGQKHAALLFDYFMNDYIRANLPSGIVNRQYFRYDLKSNTLKRGLKERFEVVN